MKKSIIVTLMLGVVVFMGCDDGLDILPTGSVSEEIFWERERDARQAVNAIRERPTVEMPPIESGKTQEELREIVRRERGVELAFEGLRLYDMNRWGIGERKEGLAQGAHFLIDGE